MNRARMAIEVTDLRKSYGTNEAVRGVSFAVAEGEVFGLLGPNGAGKTTIVEILEGYRRQDDGAASVLGYEPATAGRRLREQVGIVLQECAVPRFLTVAEVLSLYAGYYPRPRPVEEVMDLVGLADRARDRVSRLSGGQQRRLDLALALVGDPRLIFLDEPTTGFDPSARRQAWEVIHNVCRLGKTVLLTTHYMEEAQNLADRICVIAAGRVVAEGTPDTIGGRQLAAARLSFEMPSQIDPSTIPGGGSIDGRVVVIETDTPTRTTAEVTAWALGLGLELTGLELTRPTLEDVYLELTR